MLSRSSLVHRLGESLPPSRATSRLRSVSSPRSRKSQQVAAQDRIFSGALADSQYVLVALLIDADGDQ